MEPPNMSYMILYGSVTGKAESIACLIAEESERKKLNFTKKCLSKIDNIDFNQQKHLVIITSTTGDGEQPENALPFLKKLKCKEIQNERLQNISYTILGLGDSNYSQFCNGPKTIHEKLLSLGAKTFYEPKWADDGVGLDIVVEPWIDGLWAELEKFQTSPSPTNIDNYELHNNIVNGDNSTMDVERYNTSGLKEEFDKHLKEANIKNITDKLGGISITTNKQKELLKDLVFPSDTNLVLPNCSSSFLKLNYHELDSTTHHQNEEKLYHLKDKDLLEVTVKDGKKLSKAGAVKDCYQVTFDFKQENGKVSVPELLPGDAVDIICCNPRTEIDSILDRLGLLNELADKICISASLLPDCKKSAKIPEHMPKNGELFSIRHILTNCVEIRSVPKKPFIRMLVDFTSDDLERRRLEELCSRQGGNNYLSVIRGNNICLLDILLTFPSCQPPMGNVQKLISYVQTLGVANFMSYINGLNLNSFIHCYRQPPSALMINTLIFEPDIRENFGASASSASKTIFYFVMDRIDSSI